MAIPLILLDVDKTMIDQNFRLTDSEVLLQIKKMIEAGWQIGLNSDRPFLQLSAFRRQWRLNGPLICEMGNAVYSAADERPLFEDDFLRRQFNELFLEVIAEIREKYPKVTILIGDIPEILSLLDSIPSAKPESYILVSGQRRFSFGLNVRMKISGRLIPEKALLKRTAEISVRLFSEIFRHAARAIIDYNDYGSCILHSPRANKAKGFAVLKNHCVYSAVVVIGDSQADYISDPGVVHCGVANAEDAFKRECCFVASQTFSAGVRECLDWVEQTILLPR